MRLIVCGSRDYEDTEHVFNVLDSYRNIVTCIITGGATGADELACAWAKERGIPLLIVPAQWGQYGKSAGPVRNGWMIDVAGGTHVLAFPGGRGTANMVLQAQRKGLSVIDLRQEQSDATL